MATITRIYDSLDALIEKADEAHRQGKAHHGSTDSDYVGRKWQGWTEARDFARSPWQEGLQAVESMLAQLSAVELPAPMDRKRRPRWSADNGDEVCNDRLRAGQDYWRETRRQDTRAPQQVRIVFQLWQMAMQNSFDALWRGAASICLANLLESAGYRVELWVAESCREAFDSTRDPKLTCACLKRADQPLDLATLVNAIAGWFLRTVVWQEHYSYPQAPTSFMAMQRPIDPAELAELVGTGETIVIDDIWNRSAALARVREIIESLNGGNHAN